MGRMTHTESSVEATVQVRVPESTRDMAKVAAAKLRVPLVEFLRRAVAASLYAEGQKTPLRVHEVPGKRFRIHAGDTRYWSFMEIDKRRDWPWGKPEDKGRPRVECLVETFDPKIDRDKAAFGSSLTENIQRNDLTLVDLSNAVIIAERQGYTPAEIMAQLRQTDPTFISRMHKIAVLPVARKRELFLNQISASTAYLLAEIPEEEHEGVLADAAAMEPDASSHSADTVEPRPKMRRGSAGGR